MPPYQAVQEQVGLALAEDVRDGDRTASLIPESSVSTVQVVCREQAVLCGTAWFNEVFQQLDSGINIAWQAEDGATISADSVICEMEAIPGALLTGGAYSP